MKKYIVSVVVLFLVLLGLFVFELINEPKLNQCGSQGDTCKVNVNLNANINGASDYTDLIKVISLKANDEIKSPLTITGQARGSWYFEASFPVILNDANGQLVANGIAQAQSDWMTTNFVPFSTTLNFATPQTETGTLIFKNDNPSGLPANDKSISLPIKFSKDRTIELEVFFGNPALSSSSETDECKRVYRTYRYIKATPAVAQAAINELLKGPTEAEKNIGFFTSLNSGIKFQKLTIKNGVARIDFDETLEKAVGGSCRVAAIHTQITQTLMQFPTVKSVIISVNDRTADILQP